MKKSTQRILLAVTTVFALSGMAEAKQKHEGGRVSGRDSQGEYHHAYRDNERENRQARFEKKIHKRLENQRQRIKRGKRNGELTHWEKQALRRDQKMIRRLIREYGEDGHYARWERRRINEAQDRAGESIRELKHNHAYAYNSEFKKPRFRPHYYYDRHNRSGFTSIWFDF